MADGNENIEAIDACLYSLPPEEHAEETDLDMGVPSTFVQTESWYLVLVVVIIVFTSYYFSLTLSSLNIVGIAVAVLGVLLFCYSRSKEKKAQNEITK